MKNKIREKLIEVAKKRNCIFYSVLADELNIPYEHVDDRNKMHEILGNISKEEIMEGRPPLSALVIRRDKYECGNGFYELMREIKFTKQGESDEDALKRAWEECWDYWNKK